MKNVNDTIGNRSRDLPVCIAVPQPLRHQQRAPNIKIDLQKVGCGVKDWIELAQDRDRWRALVKEVMFHKMWGIS
jgi:hypothetical protein